MRLEQTHGVGFVRIIGPSELAFPNYDGNGMFPMLGNITGSAQVGLLFIDFERPHRVRVHGRAGLTKNKYWTDLYSGGN